MSAMSLNGLEFLFLFAKLRILMSSYFFVGYLFQLNLR